MKLWATFMLLLSFSQRQSALRKDCLQPLGMQSGVIKDSQLDAKSYDFRYGSERGRLGDDHGWCSYIEQPREEYFEIDLQRVRHVSAVATQGTKTKLKEYYVKSYLVKYSFDGNTWYPYKESVLGTYKEKEFTGNSNVNGVVKNTFSEEFVTRFLRIYPLTFKNDMCLKVEVYGCAKDDCSKFIEQSSGEIMTPNHPGLYPVGVDCTWIIKGSLSHKIVLLSKYFDVGDRAGSCSDNLEVRDGPQNWSPLLGTYCDGQHPTLVKSAEELMRIQFHSSQNSNPKKGFQLHFMQFTPGDNDEVFSATACDGANLRLNCSKFVTAINVLRTFFGAYPFAQDCGALYSNTSCQASDVRQKVLYHCQDYKQCDFPVQQSSFGHSTCVNTVTQRLEVYYQCTSTNLKITTAAPAQTHPAPRKILTPAPTTSAPTTNKSTSSSTPILATTPSIRSTSTTVSQPEGTAEGTVAQLTTSKGSEVSASEGTVEARTGGGMATGSLVAVVVVAVLLILGVSLAVILYVVCKRRRKGTRTPSVRYSHPSIKQKMHKKRCNTDPDERKYDSINILYESADSKTPSQIQAEEHIYESANAVGMTENPLYMSSTPQVDGYETVQPPKCPPVMAPHLYEKPMESCRTHSKSISNPNYDKTLTVKTLPEDV